MPSSEASGSPDGPGASGSSPARAGAAPAPRRRIRALAAFLLLGVVAASGCFLLHQSSEQEPGVRIRVENEFPSAVLVSALHTGATVWREEVEQFRTVTFQLEGDRLTQGVIRFLLEPRVHRRRYLLSGVVLRRGDLVRIKIEPQLNQSYALVE